MQRTTSVKPLVPTALQSPRAKLVYLALATCGPATLDQLHERLGESRFALLGVLDVLEERELVTRYGETFRPESTETRPVRDPPLLS